MNDFSFAFICPNFIHANMYFLFLNERLESSHSGRLNIKTCAPRMKWLMRLNIFACLNEARMNKKVVLLRKRLNC